MKMKVSVMMRDMLSVIFLALAVGCASTPTGPTVSAGDMRGKLGKDRNCRAQAQQVANREQVNVTDRQVRGAVAGGAGGAALGGIAGSHRYGWHRYIGHSAEAMLVGAALGAAAGAALTGGNDAQDAYNAAYLQCMRGP